MAVDKRITSKRDDECDRLQTTSKCRVVVEELSPVTRELIRTWQCMRVERGGACRSTRFKATGALKTGRNGSGPNWIAGQLV